MISNREIIDALKADIKRKDLIFVKNLPESELITLHHTLGRYIRNEYKLWTYEWEPEMKMMEGIEVDCSPNHPDARSMNIITELWKELQNIEYPTEEGYYKMYIATLDEAPDYMYRTLVAHSVLGAHLKFQNDPTYQDWLKNSFRKVTIRVSREEFENIRKLENVYEGYENTILNGEISCLVTIAKQGEVPNALYEAKLWKPKKK